MKPKSFNRKAVGGMTLIFTFGIIAIASAQPKRFAKSGFYLGVARPYNTIAGDFTGNNVLHGGGEVIAIPKVTNSFGSGALLGYRFGNGALEASYLHSTHGVTFLDAASRAEYHLVNLDARYYLFARKPVQPFALIGATLDWLIVKNGSATETEVGDATFAGGGFSAGAGIAFHLTRRLSVSGEATYRYLGYSGEQGVKGVSGQWKEISEGLDGSGLGFTAAMRFTF